MKKYKVFYILSILILVLSLSGCCMHSYIEATCTEPKTCSKCGVTEGVAKGHTFHEATCNAPKTCEICGYTEGEKLEHRFLEATCDSPETCDICGEVRGEALGHTTGFGICERCGEAQTYNSSFATTILESINEGANYLADGLSYMSTAYSMSTATYRFEYTYKAYEHFLFATVPFETALTFCMDFPEFADVKKEIQEVYDGLVPLKEWETLSASDLSRLNAIYEEITPHMHNIFEITANWTAFIE